MSFPVFPGNVGMFTYDNGMLFISPVNETFTSVYDHTNLTLLTTISCDSYLSWPEDLIFIESENIMIIVLAKTN